MFFMEGRMTGKGMKMSNYPYFQKCGAAERGLCGKGDWGIVGA